MMSGPAWNPLCKSACQALLKPLLASLASLGYGARVLMDWRQAHQEGGT